MHGGSVKRVKGANVCLLCGSLAPVREEGVMPPAGIHPDAACPFVIPPKSKELK